MSEFINNSPYETDLNCQQLGLDDLGLPSHQDTPRSPRMWRKRLSRKDALAKSGHPDQNLHTGIDRLDKLGKDQDKAILDYRKQRRLDRKRARRDRDIVNNGGTLKPEETVWLGEWLKEND